MPKLEKDTRLIFVQGPLHKKVYPGSKWPMDLTDVQPGDLVSIPIRTMVVFYRFTTVNAELSVLRYDPLNRLKTDA